mmetsp:Transcript_9129/g.9777  ORF Transcript_9129/g.9777 Transcript_9129/m.9777 type:complete len:245 (+) Transcript_9129:167-901(+)
MTTLTMRSKWTKTKSEDDSVSDDDSICNWDESGDEYCVDDHHSDHHEDRPYILALRRGYKEEIEEMSKGDPVEITPHLYIGDSDCVLEKNKDKLRKRNITAVLNMAGNPGTPADPTKLAGEWKQKIQDGSFLYKAIAADDTKTYPLLENHWTEAKQFLDQALNENRACLVHCVAGQNRSGLIVCAYYMLSQRRNVLETVEYVRSRRGTEVLKNPGFQRQLVQLAKAENLLGPKPPIDSTLKNST